jgi:hypothetical protein
LFPQLFILARDNDSDVIKIVVGIVFLALWGLGALISAWNKRAEEERRRRQLGQLPKTLGTDPYARQYSAQAQYGYPVVQPPPPPAPSQQRSKKRRKSSISAPPVPTPPPEIHTPAPMAVQAQAPARPSPASESARIGRLVHRHDSLRAALILQEVLSPPLSLR